MYYLLILNIGMPELILVLFFGVIPLTLLLISLVDIYKSEFKEKTSKWMWAIIAFAMPVLGPLLYLLFGRPGKLKG